MDTYSFPTSPAPNTISNEVAYTIIDKKECCTAYTNITRKFLQKSSGGNQYLLIGYHYDANCILAEPMRDRTPTSITNTWSNLHYIFDQAGVAPYPYIMDNEISNQLIQDLRQ